MKAKYDFSRAKRGAVVPLPKGKSEIRFAIEDELLDWFRAQIRKTNGGDYQVLMNEALREYVKNRRDNSKELARRGV